MSEQRDIVRVIRATGSVTSPRAAMLSASVAGLIETYAVEIGDEVEVLLEGPSKSNADRLQGRSAGNLNVVVERTGNERAVGRRTAVRIVDSTNLTLYGEVTAAPPTLVGTGGIEFGRPVAV